LWRCCWRTRRGGAEKAEFDDVVRGLGEGLSRAYAALHGEYEERAGVEARLVKAADVIDLLAQALAFERAGARELDEFWEGAEERDFGLEGAARGVVGEVIAALVAARAELRRGR
jgi:putative hydrolase of HD superfamily